MSCTLGAVVTVRRRSRRRGAATEGMGVHYAIVILRYRKPLDQVLPHVDAHRAYLRGLKERGVVLASGPFVPRAGGVLLLRIADADVDAALDRIRDEDPFSKAGVAQYELLPWEPVIGRESLDELK
jgi:uncharacterized protein YciI